MAGGPPLAPIFVFGRLRVDRVRVPFRLPLATASRTWVAREGFILRLEAADGRVGVGEAALEASDEAAAGAFEALVRELVSSPRRLTSTGDLETFGGPGRALRAGIDAARLDLAGPPAGALTPTGRGVGVNATIGAGDIEASVAAALRAVADGFRTIKLKVGSESDTRALVARVGAVRSAVGPGVRLRLDANGAWDLETAVERLTALGTLDLEVVEQPVPASSPGGLARLRSRVRVPIAADEAVVSAKAARALLAADAVDVLVVKPARVGGPVAAAEIADMAVAHGVGVVVSTLFETGVGVATALACAAAVPTVRGAAALDHGLATADLLEDDLLVEAMPIDAGRMRVPGGPDSGGLGIVLDHAALERYRVSAIETGG